MKVAKKHHKYHKKALSISSHLSELVLKVEHLRAPFEVCEYRWIGYLSDDLLVKVRQLAVVVLSLSTLEGEFLKPPCSMLSSCCVAKEKILSLKTGDAKLRMPLTERGLRLGNSRL